MGKELKLTKDEALSLSMAYRNELNRFGLLFKDLGDVGIRKEGKKFFDKLNLLQWKLEQLVASFGEEK